ncbi:MAG: YdeI/OmpD-associated family protein [Bacteroidota bacterium]
MAKSYKETTELFYPPDRQAWREWLKENHTTYDRIWLIYYKKESGMPSISYDEAVEEALCFGWIDSVPNKIDDQKYKQLFSVRKKKSPWSRLNKTRVEKLSLEGLMAPAGQAMIDRAKADGSWTVYDAVEDLIIPPDLAAALASTPFAEENFLSFAPTYRKGILWWVISAKRPETRAKRVETTARMAAKNLKAQFDKES